jgi:hypothetical protein
MVVGDQQKCGGSVSRMKLACSLQSGITAVSKFICIRHRACAVRELASPHGNDCMAELPPKRKPKDTAYLSALPEALT